MIWKKEKQKQKKFANLLVLLESGYGLQQHIFPDCFRMKPEAITIHVEDQSEINDPEAGLIPKTSTEESGENDEILLYPNRTRISQKKCFFLTVWLMTVR